MPRVSVVTVNYNAGPLLAEGVRQLLQAERDALEIIVVDNASADDSLSQLPNDARLRVIRNADNRGFAAACNQGAALAQGEYLLFLNPDCHMDVAALDRLQDTLARHPEAGMAGPLILNPDGSEQRGCRRHIPDPGRALAHLSGLARRHPERFPGFNATGHALPDAATPVEAISGACMLLPRPAFDLVGGWDEGYFLHAEDLDLCQRIHDAGLQILFEPKACISHRQGTCSRGRPIWVEWHKHRGMWRFYRKFQAAGRPTLLNGLVLSGIWLHFLARAAKKSVQ